MLVQDYLIFYSFKGYGCHRDLPAFPTRPSSNLAAVSHRRAVPLCVSPPRHPRWVSPASGTSALAPRARRHRSEEHTSELQSRQYLVCRLLLEKKRRRTDGAYLEILLSPYLHLNL